METSTVRGLSIGHTILGVFVITTVTVIIGMVTNRYALALALRTHIEDYRHCSFHRHYRRGDLCRTGHDFRFRHHNRLKEMMVPA